MSFPLAYPHVAPTLTRAEYFYPRQDAETLRRAMKGIGTDERAIITVLAERTNQQRLEIAEEFKKNYNRDLIKNFRSELSGDFRDLVVSSMLPMYEMLARELYSAVHAANMDIVTEIICTHCNEWLHGIAAAYLAAFDMPVERELRDCGAPGSRLLAALSRGLRDEEMRVDEEAIVADAQALVTQGGRLSTEDSRLTTLLTTRSQSHVRRTLIEYEKLVGQPFEETIRNEYEGAEEKAMQTIIRAMRNSTDFLACRFHNSMIGLGTNERSLNRLVLNRAELDLEDIKQAFVIKYKKSLASFIEGDTSGFYKKMLRTLVK